MVSKKFGERRFRKKKFGSKAPEFLVDYFFVIER